MPDAAAAPRLLALADCYACSCRASSRRRACAGGRPSRACRRRAASARQRQRQRPAGDEYLAHAYPWSTTATTRRSPAGRLRDLGGGEWRGEGGGEACVSYIFLPEACHRAYTHTHTHTPRAAMRASSHPRGAYPSYWVARAHQVRCGALIDQPGVDGGGGMSGNGYALGGPTWTSSGDTYTLDLTSSVPSDRGRAHRRQRTVCGATPTGAPEESTRSSTRPATAQWTNTGRVTTATIDVAYAAPYGTIYYHRVVLDAAPSPTPPPPPSPTPPPPPPAPTPPPNALADAAAAARADAAAAAPRRGRRRRPADAAAAAAPARPRPCRRPRPRRRPCRRPRHRPLPPPSPPPLPPPAHRRRRRPRRPRPRRRRPRHRRVPPSPPPLASFISAPRSTTTSWWGAARAGASRPSPADPRRRRRRLVRGRAPTRARASRSTPPRRGPPTRRACTRRSRSR